MLRDATYRWWLFKQTHCVPNIGLGNLNDLKLFPIIRRMNVATKLLEKFTFYAKYVAAYLVKNISSEIDTKCAVNKDKAFVILDFITSGNITE